jgi:hypothetical protein
LTGEPLALWLNNGSGRFRKGRLADHRVDTLRVGGPGLTTTLQRRPERAQGAPARSWVVPPGKATGITATQMLDPIVSCFRQAPMSPCLAATGSRAPPLPPNHP